MKPHNGNVTRLIRLSQYRKVLELPVIEDEENDRDLLPVAIVLWISSIIRIVSGVIEGEVFQTEATLALACSIGLPVWIVRSRRRRQQPQSTATGGPGGPSRPPGARIIAMPISNRAGEVPDSVSNTRVARFASRR